MKGKTKRKAKGYIAELTALQLETIGDFLQWADRQLDHQEIPVRKMKELQPDNAGHVKQLAYIDNARAHVRHLLSVVAMRLCANDLQLGAADGSKHPRATRRVG